MSEAWARRDDETPKAWAAFCVYRELGAGRSIPKALETSGKPVGSLRWWELWSRTFDWVARCRAYDTYIEELKREKHETEILRATKKHREAAEALIDKGLAQLQVLGEEDISAGATLGMVSEGVKLHRLTLGLTTNKIEEDVNGRIEIKAGGELSRRILEDPGTAELACDLLERVAARKDDAGRVRDGRKPGQMDPGEAPVAPEPEAR